MSEPSVTLESAARDEDGIDYVERLLAENDLPADDVRSKPECFYVARRTDVDGDDAVDDPRVGTGGLEPHGDVGLLRSVVVEGSARGNGYGTAICDGLEAVASSDDLDDLYLLTTTASDFFLDRGYETVARDEVPASIRETTQFSELCPESATVMRKSV